MVFLLENGDFFALNLKKITTRPKKSKAKKPCRRYIDMAGQASFRQILADFLREDLPQRQATPDERPSPLESIYPFISLNIEIKRRPKVQVAFPAQKRHTPQTPPKVAFRPQTITSIQIALARLSAGAQNAIHEILSLNGQSCPQTISRKELKRIYRRLAKNFHPDTCAQEHLKKNGSVAFIRLRENFKLADCEIQKLESQNA